MSYVIEKTASNGYRCGCCKRTWTDTAWEDDRDKALETVPLEPVFGEGYELEEVEVKDGATGEVVAQGDLTTPPVWCRGAAYEYSHWHGWRGEEHFDVLLGGDKQPVIDKTWEECWEEVRAKGEARRRQKAEQKLKEAQAELAKLGPPPEGG